MGECFLPPQAKFHRCSGAKRIVVAEIRMIRGAVGTISSRDESMEEESGILRGAVMRERRTRAGDETIVLHPRRAKRKMYLAWQSSNKGRDARVNPCHPASLSFFPRPPSLSILRFLQFPPSRVTLRTTNSRSPSVKGLTSLRLIVEH